MAGIKLPLQPTEHQYLVTDTIPEIEKMKYSAGPRGGNAISETVITGQTR